jgi:carbamoyl-phosphate synthase large subunit
LIINTPNGKGARTDEGRIRAASVQYGVPCITTLSAGRVAVEAMKASRNKVVDVLSLQERFA